MTNLIQNDCISATTRAAPILIAASEIGHGISDSSSDTKPHKFDDVFDFYGIVSVDILYVSSFGSCQTVSLSARPYLRNS